MNIAFVGCGYIADSYIRTLPLYPDLRLAGIFDRDAERNARFSKFYSVKAYASFNDLLADGSLDMVVNLTNPRSHFVVSKACLESGKSVYSEKPMAMLFSEAEELVNMAKRMGVHIASAPSRLLAETAQTLWKAVRENVVGKIRLVYSEMDHGLTHRMRYDKWLSASGTPWPYKDEFETGCTLEHAEYPLRLLTAFFGPVESVTAFSSCQIPDKETKMPLDGVAPDYSVANLKFRTGLVARLTCGIIAPPDRTMKFYGDDGILYTDDISQPGSPVYLKRRHIIRRRTILTPWKIPYKMASPPRSPSQIKGSRHKEIDFCLGIAELASSIKEGRPCRLSSEYCLHTTEVALAIQGALDKSCAYRVKTSFTPIDPMPWSK